MQDGLILRFLDDVSIEEPASGSLRISSLRASVTLGSLPASFLQAIRLLAAEGASEEELANRVSAGDSGNALARLYQCLDVFGKRALLRHTVVVDGRPLAVRMPLGMERKPKHRSFDRDGRHVLSRFAFTHRLNDEPVLESPLSLFRVHLCHWGASAIVHLLATPRTLDELARELPAIPASASAQFVALLHEAHMAEAVDEAGATAESTSPALRQWEFHDLLFHSRSRMGNHERPLGATFRFQHEVEPLPAIKSDPAGVVIDLCRPDLEKLRSDDSPFTLVLEERRSVRDHGDRPLTKDQLGEFLFRCARVKATLGRDDSAGRPYEATRRVSPGGGGMYEIEIYPLVRECEGVPPGLYHYDPAGHRLVKYANPDADTAALLTDAHHACANECMPQVLLVLASRFQRMAWKYEAMAYAVSLKTLGALLQTMYLVATAMDLAPCAIGCGDSDRFARAAGLDPLQETSVGEFMLGSRRRGKE